MIFVSETFRYISQNESDGKCGYQEMVGKSAQFFRSISRAWKVGLTQATQY